MLDRHQGDFFRANNLTVFAQSLVRDVFVMSYKVFDLLNSDIRDQCFSAKEWDDPLAKMLMNIIVAVFGASRPEPQEIVSGSFTKCGWRE